MILSHVVAVGQKNLVIGNKNTLPWGNIPGDRKYFRNLTTNHPIIMGRKTFNSLNDTPLPRRHNIVISRAVSAFKMALFHENVTFTSSIKEAISFCKENFPDEPEVFIIGGSEIYKESMPLISKIYLTLIHHDFEGDTFYPEIPKKFKEISREDKFDSCPTGGKHAYYYSFIVLQNSNFSIEF